MELCQTEPGRAKGVYGEMYILFIHLLAENNALSFKFNT